MDEDLAELMNRTDPARTEFDRRTDADIQAELHRITMPRAAERPRRRWAWMTLPAMAAIAAAVAVVVQVWNPIEQPATAATPPMLPVSKSNVDARGAIDQALATLSASDTYSSKRRAELEGWYLQTEVDSEGDSASVIAPQEQELAWNDDLSGTITLTAGRAYLPTEGLPSAPNDASVPVAGTVLSSETFPAGHMPVLFQAAPPSTAAEMKQYLAATTGVALDADAISYLHAVRILMSEWTLSPSDQASVLSALADLDGIEIAGEVTDRLGRAGVALRVTSPESPHFENLLILSSETGSILALETIYLGGLPNLTLPTPSVVDYTAWK